MNEILRQIFNASSENVNPNLLQEPVNYQSMQALFDKKISKLPQLPLEQLHILCRNQEKNVSLD